MVVMSSTIWRNPLTAVFVFCPKIGSKPCPVAECCRKEMFFYKKFYQLKLLQKCEIIAK